MQNKSYTYDKQTLSDVEILAPNINQNQSMLEAKALRRAMFTADTRDAILQVTNNKTKIKLSEAKEVLRLTASLLRAKAQNVVNNTADTKPQVSFLNPTIEQVQQMQNEFYKNQKY